MTSVSTLLDRGGEGSQIEQTHFVDALFVLNQEWYVFWLCEHLKLQHLGQNYKIRHQAHFLIGDPSTLLSTQVDNTSFM